MHRMREFVMESASSFSATVVRTVKGDPSRCCRMVPVLLKEPDIDLVQRRMADRHCRQPPAGHYHAPGDLGAGVFVGVDTPQPWALPPAPRDAGRARERLCKVAVLGIPSH